MSLLAFIIQTTVPSPGNAESADPLKSWAQIVAIIGGVAALVVILVTRTWPWIKAKLDRRSIQKRIGAEAFPPANIEQSLRYYVTPYCQNIDPAGGEEPRAIYGVKQNLFEVLDDALSHQTEYRYLILLADSGMGKTSALLSYYARHIRSLRRRRSFQLAVIPLGIPNADELIGAVENKRDTVLFLDALDEDTLANVDHVIRVRDLLVLTRDFSRVVITCRSQFFPKDEEIPRETGILKVGARKAGEGAEYVFHKLYKGFVKKENLRQLSELLAVDLYVNRQTRGGEFVPLDDLAGLAQGWRIPIDEWRLGSRSLLNRDAQGNYKFAHRSIMEYFCVKRFAEGDPTLNDAEWTDQMNLFVRELFESRQEANYPSSPRINMAGWDSKQCVTLVRAVWHAEERVPHRRYRPTVDVLRALKEMMQVTAASPAPPTAQSSRCW